MGKLTERLTVKAVKALGPGLHHDGDGLYLQVIGEGRSWISRGTTRGAGKARDYGLGPARRITLDRARELNTEAQGWRAEGIDPIERRRAGKTAARLDKAKGVTFKQVAEEYIAAHSPGWKNPVH